MVRDMDDRVDELEREVTSMRDSMAIVERKIDKLWAARSKDKASARKDSERRHAEVMAAIKEINGDVRDHSTRLARIETRHAIADRASGERKADDRTVVVHDPRKLAAMAGAAGGGLPSAIVLIYMLWQLLGGGG